MTISELGQFLRDHKFALNIAVVPGQRGKGDELVLQAMLGAGYGVNKFVPIGDETAIDRALHELAAAAVR